MIERVVCLVWILIGTAAGSMALNMGLFGPYGPDSGLFPFVASGMVGLGGLVLLFSRRHHAPPIEWPPRDGIMRVGGVIAGLALMTIALPLAGFAVSGFATMLVLLRTVERTSWVQSVLLAVVSVIIVIVLFDRLLGMPLPKGPWGV